MRFSSILDAEAQTPKLYFSGTHRIRSPRETFDRYREFLPAFGITRLANVTGLDFLGVPVWQCIRPNARVFAVSQGKGTSHDAAMVSALMESIETWHAENADLGLRYDSWANMRRKYRTIDISRLPRRHLRPVRPHLMRLWCEGLDLITGEDVWVPTARVTTSQTAMLRDPDLYGDTNGLSSGNSHSEALVHGLCEVIERDAWLLWEDSPIAPHETRVDLSSIRSEEVLATIRAFNAAGLVVGVYDATDEEVGVPVYIAVISDRPGNHRAMGMFRGFGCHLDPSVAISRALTEAAQCRLAQIAGAREDIWLSTVERRATDLELAAIEAEIEGSPAPVRLDARKSMATSSPGGDIAHLIERLKSAGVTSVVGISLTKPEFEIPVVRVVATDLELPAAAPNTRCTARREARRASAP